MTVTVCLPGDPTRIYVASFPNTILDDVGVRRPAAQDELLPAGEERIEISNEEIPLLDAEVVIRATLVNFPSDIDTNPLWQQLPAVQAGRVVDVNGQLRNSGSVLAARLVLDELQAALAEPT